MTCSDWCPDLAASRGPPAGKSEEDSAVRLAFDQLKDSRGQTGSSVPAGQVEFTAFLQYYKDAIVAPDTDGRIVEGPRVREWAGLKRKSERLSKSVTRLSRQLPNIDDKEKKAAAAAELELLQAEAAVTKSQEANSLQWLRQQKVCSSKARHEFWGSRESTAEQKKLVNGAHLQQVFEVVKSEDTYVRSLLFMRQVWYLPLATGSHGAPQLDSGELDSLFSTLFSRPEGLGNGGGGGNAAGGGGGSSDEMDRLTKSLMKRGLGRNISTMRDILSFQLQYFLPALMEEERKEVRSKAPSFCCASTVSLRQCLSLSSVLVASGRTSRASS
eukprot:SAG22_NODE_97_length_20760_cov_43.302850_9_plen_328_part_00